MDRITEVTKDCFNALAQLRNADAASLPPAEELHSRLRTFIDALFQKASAAGFGREEAADIAYAIVALADELVLSGPSDSMRAYWSAQPLQIHYFHTNVAGEEFFSRLEAIRKDARRQEILKAYYLALLFGFQGRYRVRGGELELMGIVDGVARDLGRRDSDLEVLSPSGERPDSSKGRGARTGPLLWISTGALVLALIVYVALRFSVASTTEAVHTRITATVQQ